MSWFEQFIFVFKHIPWVLGQWQFPLVLLALVLFSIYMKWTDT